MAFLAAALLVHHFGAWAYVATKRAVPVDVLLDRWDANIYSEIARHGYSGDLFAFLPLYPLCVRGLAWALNLLSTPQYVGAALSTLLLLLFILISERTPTGEAALTPRTVWGWAVFLFSPASYVFHSHHTESLFVVLSFVSLYWASTDRPLKAGLASALCILTRNQGFLVALAVGLFILRRSKPGDRLRRLALASVPIALSVCGLLLFEWLAGGDALAFVHAQRQWSHADSLHSVLATFWFGNPWQYPDLYSWLSLVFFLSLGVATVPLIRRCPPLGVYAALSLIIQLGQGELVHAFRYGAVLFPILFLAGDWLSRLPRSLRWTAFACLVLLNHNVTLRYALGRWAY
ncbi:MAG TPA: mannosyltransferase family protein [Myxococcaceae bacterium]|nr:mannosyltransferase family protein [Myxococcaceae bacterium]